MKSVLAVIVLLSLISGFAAAQPQSGDQTNWDRARSMPVTEYIPDQPASHGTLLYADEDTSGTSISID
jgi:hypothetical protein